MNARPSFTTNCSSLMASWSDCRKDNTLLKNLLVCAALAATAAQALPAGNRITLPSGEKIFLSGFNLAWSQNGSGGQNFASDVGDAPWSTGQEAYFRKSFKDVADSGGNVMRVWLSTNGGKDPKFGADGLVSGLGANTIVNVKKMLSIAKENKILLMPVLLTHNFMQKNAVDNGGSFENNRKLLTTDAGIKAYIDNAVVPLVKAIGNDPNLICWEICNECEGMVEGVGWTDQKISKADVQKISNRMAGAIHRAVPGVLVSTGIVQASLLNWYTDATLKSVGADADGTLDFYMVHYYGWNGPSNSPFKKSASAWSVDKPLVVGEFASNSWSQSTASSSTMQDAEKIDTLLENLYKNGYAGGLFWQYQKDSDAWMEGFPTASPSMAKLGRAHVEDVKFDGVADGKLSVMAGGTPGGTVTISPEGRVAPGTVVTLTATPNVGYDFTGWSGDTTATATTLKVTVNKDRNLLAVFTPGAGTNLIKGGTFTTTADQGAWVLGNYPTPANASTVNYANGSAAITVTASDTTDFGVQIRQGGIPLDSNMTYVVTFDAFASVARDITPTLTTGDWKWQSNTTVSLTTTKAPYSIELKSNINSADGMLQFCVGKLLTTVTIDNVTMVRKGSAAVLPGARKPSVLSLRAVEGGFAWLRGTALTSPATVRVVDVNGSELARTEAAVGATTGLLPAAGSGLRFVVLESQDTREVHALPSLR